MRERGEEWATLPSSSFHCRRCHCRCRRHRSCRCRCRQFSINIPTHVLGCDYATTTMTMTMAMAKAKATRLRLGSGCGGLLDSGAVRNRAGGGMGTGLVSVVGWRAVWLLLEPCLRDVGVTVQRQRFVDICWMFKESKNESSNCNSKSSGNKPSNDNNIS